MRSTSNVSNVNEKILIIDLSGDPGLTNSVARTLSKKHPKTEIVEFNMLPYLFEKLQNEDNFDSKAEVEENKLEIKLSEPLTGNELKKFQDHIEKGKIKKIMLCVHGTLEDTKNCYVKFFDDTSSKEIVLTDFVHVAKFLGELFGDSINRKITKKLHLSLVMCHGSRTSAFDAHHIENIKDINHLDSFAYRMLSQLILNNKELSSIEVCMIGRISETRYDAVTVRSEVKTESTTLPSIISPIRAKYEAIGKIIMPLRQEIEALEAVLNDDVLEEEQNETLMNSLNKLQEEKGVLEDEASLLQDDLRKFEPKYGKISYSVNKNNIKIASVVYNEKGEKKLKELYNGPLLTNEEDITKMGEKRNKPSLFSKFNKIFNKNETASTKTFGLGPTKP